MLSEAVEDYLKAIYDLQSAHGPARTSSLARRLGVSAGSVSEMLKRLSEMQPQLVTYARHRGVRLTPAGEKAALSVIRRHRLLETLLHEHLGFSWDEVHEEADRLEHYISERLTSKIETYLDHPTADPHGDPIPQADGRLEHGNRMTLSTVSPGQTVKISRVHHSDPGLLKYLEQKGIRLRAVVTVVEKAPLNGPITVRLLKKASSSELSLDEHVAASIYVEPYRKISDAGRKP